MFSVLHSTPDSKARIGVLSVGDVRVETPCFMPVATKGCIRAVPSRFLEDAGFRLILMNIFHLALRPGIDVVEKGGGVRKWSGWPGIVLTDSGGYQIFSLTKKRKVRETHVEFQSPIDGKTVTFSPESVVEIQVRTGVDILMPLDYPSHFGAENSVLADSTTITRDWLGRSIRKWSELGKRGHLFGIVQGGFSRTGRESFSEFVSVMDVDGFSLGGFCLGEPKDATDELVDVCTGKLDRQKPVYLMGVGTPADIASAALRGVDMFDCILPTRLGRNGWAFTSEGMLKVRNAEFSRDEKPLDLNCVCPVCKRHSRSFIRHCFNVNEINALTLTSIHNLFYYYGLMEEIRGSIKAGTLPALVARLKELEARNPISRNMSAVK